MIRRGQGDESVDTSYWRESVCEDFATESRDNGEPEKG